MFNLWKFVLISQLQTQHGISDSSVDDIAPMPHSQLLVLGGAAVTEKQGASVILHKIQVMIFIVETVTLCVKLTAHGTCYLHHLYCVLVVVDINYQHYQESVRITHNLNLMNKDPLGIISIIKVVQYF